MNEYAILKVSRIATMRRQRSVTIEKISLVSTKLNLSERKLCKLMSSLALILRVWTVRCLDLTKFHIEGHNLILLLCLDRPVSIRMSDENVHQLAEIVYETQDDLLTQSFLEKVGGDLSSATLAWNVLLYLLQKTKSPLTLDPQKNIFGSLNVQGLLPLLHSIRFCGTDSQFVRNALKEIYTSRAGHIVTNLVRSSDNWIDLSEQVLESYDCAALRFALHYSDEVKLNLLGATIPKEEAERILQLLHRVTELSIAKSQLLQLIVLTRLSNNYITDAGAQSLQTVLTRTQTVHIFNNRISDMRFFMNNQCNPELNHNWPSCVGTEKGDCSKFPSANDFEPVLLMKASTGILNKRITTVAIFDPEISVHDDQVVYRFDCEIGGEFQCKATELVFGMKGRGCVEYRVIHWDMDCFSKNSYEPAGPLYDIKTPIGEMYQLRLPHCEAEADALGEICVAHSHDGVMEILTPVQMSSTHVTVRINGLSTFGPVRKKGCMTRYIRGQVLLFLDRISTVEQRLWVFLLARNVSTTEIKKQHQEFTPIKTSSDCILRQKGKYCLSSSLKRYKVQPKTYTFHVASDPDHHSAFELFFASDVSELRLKILEKRSNTTVITKWNRRVILRCNDKCADKIKIEDGSNGKENALLSEKNWRSSLCDLFDELHEDELGKIKSYMRNYTQLAPIPRGKVEKKKERHELVDLIVETWGFLPSVQAIKDFMRKLPRNDHAVTSILKPYLVQFGLIKEQISALIFQ
ncbi:hypothetical protein NFI96_020396 [Prochilodus magdalenae]|nr:hypothetical protein NFI96_020396 [Prochilodus magdalenae]